MIYEVALNPIEEVGWIFCVCKKRDAKALKSTYQDVDFFGKPHDPSIFKDKLTLLTENIDVFIELFQNKNLLNYFKSVEEYLDIIYYTDQNTFCKEYFYFNLEKMHFFSHLN